MNQPNRVKAVAVERTGLSRWIVTFVSFVFLVTAASIFTGCFGPDPDPSFTRGGVVGNLVDAGDFGGVGDEHDGDEPADEGEEGASLCSNHSVDLSAGAVLVSHNPDNQDLDLPEGAEYSIIRQGVDDRGFSYEVGLVEPAENARDQLQVRCQLGDDRLREIGDTPIREARGGNIQVIF